MEPILPDHVTPARTVTARTKSAARKRRLIVLSVLVVIALIITLVGVVNADLDEFELDDFIEYWSAGRLNLTGGNPYSLEQMMAIQRQLGWDEDLPVMMWNPPPTLTLVMPFGMLPYWPARLLWLVVSLVLILLASDRLWKFYGGAAEKRGYALLVALSFMPVLAVLRMGQIGVWIMVGVVGFLLAIQRQRWLAAGLLLALTTIKPHVAYLVWVALALWWLRKPRWSLAAGGIGLVAVALAIPLLINPQVISQYLDTTLNAPPLYWRTMTWGTVLRLLFGFQYDFLQLVAPAIGLVWLLYWWVRRRAQWDWRVETPRLLLVSASTMAFGWFFDLVVLLPVVIQMGVWLSQERNRNLQYIVVVVYVVLQVGALILNQWPLDAVYFVWFTPIFLLLYLFYAARRTEPEAKAAYVIDSFDMARAQE